MLVSGWIRDARALDFRRVNKLAHLSQTKIVLRNLEDVNHVIFFLINPV